MIKKKYNLGFTLIEMVVVAGLIGLLSVGIISIFMSTIQGNYRAKLQAEIKDQGDYAITSMERTIRNTQSQPTCSMGSDPNYTKITFSQPMVGYQFVGTQIQKTIDGTTWVNILGSNTEASGGYFNCSSDNTGYTWGKVRISFTLTSKNNVKQSLAQTFETTVALRTIK